MPRVFISYRRSDTEMAAGRLREAIAKHFGNQQTFRDKEDISAGLDWLNAIQKAMSDDAIVLALIGPTWLTALDSEGRRRLDRPDDVNRVELEAALSKELRVIPLLVQGSAMPDASELPETLRSLTRRHAVKLRDDDWDTDMRRLFTALEEAGLVPTASIQTRSGPPSLESGRHPLVGSKAKAAVIIVGAAGLLSLIAVAAIVARRDQATPRAMVNPQLVGKLCEGLRGRAVAIDSNGYEGVIGASGISIREASPGLFRFQSTIEFSGDRIVKEFGQSLSDPVAGTCQDTSLQFTRTLRDKSKHLHVASLSRTADGAIEMHGNFQEENGTTTYKWSGRVIDPPETTASR
jgi:hypothetical protein